MAQPTHRPARAANLSRRYRTVLAAAGVAAVAIPAAEAGAQLCPQVRGKEGKTAKLQFGRAQPDCTNPTKTTSGGIPACPEVVPSPSDWAMGPKTKIDLSVKSEKQGDVSIQLNAANVGDGTSPDAKALASGTGALRLTTKLVIKDPTEGLLTTVPFTLTVPVKVEKGKAKLDTTINAMMQDAGLGTLPECFRGEFTAVELLDPVGGPFAQGTNPLFSERGAIAFGVRG